MTIQTKWILQKHLLISESNCLLIKLLHITLKAERKSQTFNSKGKKIHPEVKNDARENTAEWQVFN